MSRTAAQGVPGRWVRAVLRGVMLAGFGLWAGLATAQEIQIVPLEDLNDEPGLTLQELEQEGITLETFSEEPLSAEQRERLSDEQFQTFEQETAVSLAEAGSLRVLDKITGRVVDLAMEAGSTQTVGRIDVSLLECRYPTESPTSDAFVRLTIAEEGTSLFDGWMVASSPALMALDHPRYDVWALRCSARPDDALPEIEGEDGSVIETERGDRAPVTSLRPRPRP